MTKKVHPNASYNKAFETLDFKPISLKSGNNNYTKLEGTTSSDIISKDCSVTLTVWKKSLLMNCKGFTVYDCTGNIVFRVDNYVAANRGEIVLMDGDGRPLLTIRRKKLSLGGNWLVYDGESSTNPRYFVSKQHGSILGNSTKAMSLAHVLGTSSKAQTIKNYNNDDKSLIYQIEGSYAQRNVAIYNNKRQCVAEIKNKEARNGVNLGGDVFKLNIVRTSDIDSSLAMAFVILLDQMFG